MFQARRVGMGNHLCTVSAGQAPGQGTRTLTRSLGIQFPEAHGRRFARFHRRA